jgi:hypothetical protein
LNSYSDHAEIAGYSIIQGALTPLAGSPYSLAVGPYAIAIVPNGKYLYVSTQSGIYLYTIGAGGVLTLSSAAPVFTDYAAYSIQVDATGSWLLDASGAGYLYAFPIGAATGVPAGAVQQVSLGGIVPRQMTVSPDNKNVFVALGTSGTGVVPFSAAATNPWPSKLASIISVSRAGGAAVSVAVDPGNRLLYVGETMGVAGTSNTGILRAFSYDSLSGTPAEVAGSPFASGGLTPVSILPVALGAYVYVANANVYNSSNGNVAGFSVISTGASYDVTPLSSTAAAGITPAGMVADTTGSVVLLVNSGGSPDLNVFSFDTTYPGKLDAAYAFAMGADPAGTLAIASAP